MPIRCYHGHRLLLSAHICNVTASLAAPTEVSLLSSYAGTNRRICLSSNILSSLVKYRDVAINDLRLMELLLVVVVRLPVISNGLVIVLTFRLQMLIHLSVVWLDSHLWRFMLVYHIFSATSCWRYCLVPALWLMVNLCARSAFQYWFVHLMLPDSN